MTDYQIRTGKLLVCGRGAEYDITESTTDIKGCEFTITVPYKSFGVTFHEFRRALKEYLGLSQMSVNITIDGEKWKTWTYKRQVTRHLTFGTVHVNKNGEYHNKALIRVSGVLMYVKYVSAPFQIIVEINPQQSRKVLTSNRDGMMTEYGDELGKFCQQICSDTRSALENNRTTKQILAGNAREFVPRLKLNATKNNEAKFALRTLDTVPTATCVEDVEQEVRRFSRNTNSNIQEGYSANNVMNRGLSQQEQDEILMTVPDSAKGLNYIKTILPESQSRDSILEGLVIINKSTDPKLKIAAKRFHPDNWNDTHGAKRKKLFKQWLIACEWALDIYCKIINSDGVNWRPGFVFEEEIEAMYQQQDDGSHALMFNPVMGKDEGINKAGTIKYQLRDFASHVGLLTLACHEVAHIAYNWHDECFASLFTDIVKNCMEHINDIHGEMKHACQN